MNTEYADERKILYSPKDGDDFKSQDFDLKLKVLTTNHII